MDTHSQRADPKRDDSKSYIKEQRPPERLRFIPFTADGLRGTSRDVSYTDPNVNAVLSIGVQQLTRAVINELCNLAISELLDTALKTDMKKDHVTDNRHLAFPFKLKPENGSDGDVEYEMCKGALDHYRKVGGENVYVVDGVAFTCFKDADAAASSDVSMISKYTYDDESRSWALR